MALLSYFTLPVSFITCPYFVCAQLLSLYDPMDCSWDFPGRNTGVGCHFLLQGIFLTQGLNLRLLHWQWILYQ